MYSKRFAFLHAEMDGNFMSEVIAAAHAFQRASRREILTADDVRKALEICSFPAPRLSTPGFTAADPHRVDLKKSMEPLSIPMRSNSPLKFAVRGKKWVLSVCVPMAKRRKFQVPSDSFGTFAGLAALPPLQRDYARSAAVNICGSWSNSNFQVQRESLRRLGLASVRMQSALTSLVSQSRPPVHLLKKLASVGPRKNWQNLLTAEALKSGKTAAELLRCVEGTEFEGHVRSLISSRIETCLDSEVSLQLLKVFGAPAGFEISGNLNSFQQIATARKLHSLSNR